MSDLEHEFSQKTMEDQLRMLAVYHAAMATEINKTRSGPDGYHEASFHWTAADTLLRMAGASEAKSKTIDAYVQHRLKVYRRLFSKNVQEVLDAAKYLYGDA